MRTLVIRSEPQSHSGGGLRQSILRLGCPNADREKAAEVFADEFSARDARAGPLRVLVGFTPSRARE